MRITERLGNGVVVCFPPPAELTPHLVRTAPSPCIISLDLGGGVFSLGRRAKFDLTIQGDATETSGA